GDHRYPRVAGEVDGRQPSRAAGHRHVVRRDHLYGRELPRARRSAHHGAV
ncbi:MAG: hypothetical protein AVDCRST_MAG19-256, partial [uncultured Thermomicrobiales bacterium]